MIGLRCVRLRAALVDFAEGRLEEPSRAGVERHLSKCRECSETVLALREVPTELGRRVRPAPDERFWAEQRRHIADAIDRGVVREIARHPALPRRTVRLWPAVPTLAAAALLAVLARGRMSASTPQIVAQAARVETSDESFTAFVDEPATVASVDVSSLEDTTLAAMDESLEDALGGYSDGNLI